MTGNVEVDVSGAMRKFKKAGVAMNVGLPKLLSNLAIEGDRKMKKEIDAGTTRRTGNLINSVSHEVGQSQATITCSANYAKPVDEGTKPHKIVPKFKKCLAFAPAGATAAIRGGQRTGIVTYGGHSANVGLVCVKSVHHPGTKGVNFSGKTRDYLTSIAGREAKKIVKEVANEVNN